MSKEFLDWHGKAFSFFSNKECEWFPCHDTTDPDNFNCLFCFCPLYQAGDKCGGNFTFNSKGIMDCSKCLIPHDRNNYGLIIKRIAEIQKLGKGGR